MIDTIHCVNQQEPPELLGFQGFTKGVEIKTERAGFEPAEQFYPFAALAKRCFRPLSHLSR